MNSLMKKAALVLPLAFAASPGARADLLRDWNLVVTGDLYASSSETEGPVRVGGNLHINNAYTSAPRSGTTTGNGGVALMIGGTVVGQNLSNGSVKVNGEGAAVIGGTPSATLFQMNSGGSLTRDDSDAKGIGATDAALLMGYAQAFAALTPNVANTYSVMNGNTGVFTVGGVDSVTKNAVFNVSAADVFGNNSVGQFDLILNGHTFGANQSIVINVSGADVDFSGSKNFNGIFNTDVAAHIIWNFYQADTIDMNNANFKGSLLAYKATLTDMNTIEGSVFVKQIGTSLNPFDGQEKEIHPPYGNHLYQGFVPTSTAVPEPSSLAMAGIAALAALGAGCRRGRKD